MYIVKILLYLYIKVKINNLSYPIHLLGLNFISQVVAPHVVSAYRSCCSLTWSSRVQIGLWTKQSSAKRHTVDVI